MDTEELIEAGHLLKADKTFPSISIILPTNTKYPDFKNDEEKLKLIIKDVKNRINNEFPTAIADPLINKLSKIYNEIDFTHLSEGIAIYVSREQDKIFHFSFPVKEKVIIDKSFEIRDLLYATKHNPEYLVLLISSNENKLFKGLGKSLMKIEFQDAPKNSDEWKIDLHSKVGNFTDADAIKDVTLEKYLRDIDKSLSKEIKDTGMQVVICGAERLINSYRIISKNKDHILGYVEGNFENSTLADVGEKVNVILQKTFTEDQEKYMNLLDEAIGKDAFASGIKEVWRAAMEKRGRVLLVERNYSCPGKYGKSKYTLITRDIDTDSVYSLKDAVDDLIEIVLKYGGDVVFMEDNKLTDHQHIALITYF